MPDATTDLMLRDSESGDLPAITAIYRHAVLHGHASFELSPPDEPEMAARRAALLAGGFPHIVAIIGGEVLGYAYAGPYRTRPAYANTVENSVYVRHDRHGLGIGRALLARLIAEAGRRGFRQMVAIIGDSGNRSSIELHRSLGFTPVGTLRSVGWKHERWLDSVLMQRALGPGDTSPPER
jgi:phosphinothricin acetyltransferase